MTYSTSRLSSFLLSLLVLTAVSSSLASEGDVEYIVKARDSQSLQKIVKQLGDSIVVEYPVADMAVFNVKDGDTRIVKVLERRDEVEFVQKGELNHSVLLLLVLPTFTLS